MTEIDRLREEMDTVTLDMIRLLDLRIEISKKMGDAKRRNGVAVNDEARETELQGKVTKMCGEFGLDRSVAVRFLNYMINESVKVQSADRQMHLAVFRKAKALEAQGKRIIHMEVGEPDFAPAGAVRDALGEAFDGGFIKYGAAEGMPAFREALAGYVTRKFNSTAKAENVIVSPGARFSIFAAITTLLNPGDEMVIIEPAWPAYRDCALNAGVKVKAVSTTLEDGWEPRAEQVKEKINENTKMIVLNYPNNPTGKILSAGVQDEIMRIAAENGLYVLSDEIYSEYAAPGWKSALQYGYEKSIVTQSFSKSHAMTGFRIGFAVAHRDVVARMARLWLLCLTSVAEPVQYAAMKALEEDTSGNADVIRGRLDVLAQEAGRIGLDFVPPDGAMYLFARVRQDGFDGMRFADRALETGVAVAPGEGFGNYRNFIRISACRDKKTLIEGMRILGDIMGDGV